MPEIPVKEVINFEKKMTKIYKSSIKVIEQMNYP